MPEKSLKQIFNNLKAGIVGTKTAKIDSQIDSAFKSIQSVSRVVDRNIYMDTMKNMMKNIGGSEENADDILKDMNQVYGMESLQQGDRLQRYNEYEQIVTNIAYCKRALKVLVDNILSPDDITKRTIQFLATDEDGNVKEDNDETIIGRLRDIKSHLHIDKHIDKLTTCTMKKGDYFVEILHSPKGENALSIISENAIIDEEDDRITKEDAEFVLSNKDVYKDICTVTESIDITHKKVTEKKRVTFSVYEYAPFGGTLSGGSPKIYGGGSNYVKGGQATTHHKYNRSPRSKAPQITDSDIEDPYDKKKMNADEEPEQEFGSKYDHIQENKPVELKDIFLALHDPKHVIRLETERYRTCLGYLVFPKVDIYSVNFSTSWTIQTNDVNAICQKIIDKMQETLQTGQDILPDMGDLRSVVAAYLKVVKDNEDVKVRYVPPHMMSHWRLNTDKFDPYGESIFESVKFDCKLLMALKTATTIKRLTSATDKRLISVETGLPRNAKNLVEMLKEGLRKRKISIDQFGSVDTIPSHIATFEDIYIPMRDGKKFVEFDHQQFGMNPSEDIEPLKFIRDNIVANLYVPAPFLGLEENVSNRALLTVENIMFARAIISYQREFSDLLKDLFEKIYNLLNPRKLADLENIRITFPPPKASPFEHQMEYIEQMQRIIEALGQLDIPKEWLKKHYLPDFPWAEIEKFKASENLKNELGETKGEDDAAGGFGGGGGGMGF